MCFIIISDSDGILLGILDYNHYMTTYCTEEVSITFRRARLTWKTAFLSCRLASVSNALGLIVRGRLFEDSLRSRESKGESRRASRVALARLISQMKVSLYCRRDVSASVKGCARRLPLSPLSRAVREESATSSPQPLASRSRSKTNGEAWETRVSFTG